MSKWVKHNGIIRTQGLCGDFINFPSSTAQQTAEALEKLDGILTEARLQWKHLVAITIYIANISEENFEEMNGVYDKWVDPEGLPTRLCVEAKMGHGAGVKIRAEAL
jgi:enamine deaminase RidA (YjgF/YER057c/UK114 family)